MECSVKATDWTRSDGESEQEVRMHRERELTWIEYKK